MTDQGRMWDTRRSSEADSNTVAAQRELLLTERDHDAEGADAVLDRIRRTQQSDSARRLAATGVVGEVGTVEHHGGRRLYLRNHLVALTAQLPEVTSQLTGRGISIRDQEEDPRIGMTLLTLDNLTTGLDQLIRELRLEGLTTGPNDIAMQAWPVKSATSPQPTQQTLGDRPTTDATGRGITVAVIDGGFGPADQERTDGWLDGVIPPPDGDLSLDTNGVPGLDPGAGHGTFVTGIIRQVAPACGIRQYRATSPEGVGSAWRLKDCIFEAVADGCRVINLSVGYDDLARLGSPAVAVCVHQIPSDVVVVAAAGNSGLPQPTLPASHATVVAVAGLEADLSPTLWSNYGPWVNVSCPAEGIVSTYVVGRAEAAAGSPGEPDGFAGPNPVAMWSGTSFAAPQISGLLAALLGTGMSAPAALDAIRARALATRHPAHPDFGFRLRVL